MFTVAFIAFFVVNVSLTSAIMPYRMPRIAKIDQSELGARLGKMQLAAVDPSIAYTGFGLATAIGLYQKVIFARIALSWFPDLYRTFPFLSPVYTVTEPYLNFFSRQIPAIGGFDISAIPALFILDLAGNAAASLGCEIPHDLEERMRAAKVMAHE